MFNALISTDDVFVGDTLEVKFSDADELELLSVHYVDVNTESGLDMGIALQHPAISLKNPITMSNHKSSTLDGNPLECKVNAI